MICAGMTFLSSTVWSVICFAIYLLLNCDGGMVIRWMVGLLVISLYIPVIRIIHMTADEWKSFLLGVVGVASAAIAILYCMYLLVE